MMRAKIFLPFLVVLGLAAFIHSPALKAPWQGAELELFASPVHPLKNMKAGEIFQNAPGEFLGFWLCGFQARHAPSPFAFRLSHLVLILFSLSLIFVLALMMSRTSRDHPLMLLFLFASIAFHPYLAELTSRAEARGAILALFFGAIATGLLFLGLKAGAKNSLLFLIPGILFYFAAISSHFSAILVMVFLFRPQAEMPDSSLLLNKKRFLVTEFLLLVFSLVYLAVIIISSAQVPVSSWLNSYSTLGAEITLPLILTGILPVHIPSWFPGSSILWISIAGFYLVAAIYLFFNWTRIARYQEPTVHSIIILISTAIGFLAALYSFSTAYLFGLFMLIVFAGMIFNLILDSGHPGSGRKALVGIIAVLILFLLGTLSFNHADLKKHDLVTARHLVKVEPENSSAWLELSRSYLAHSQPELAENVLQEAMAALPEDDQNLLLFQIELAKDNLIVAEGLFNEFLQARLDDESRRFYKCQVSAKEGQGDSARLICEEGFSDPTMNAAALNQLGAMFLKQGEENEGATLLERAHELDRFYPSALNNLGFLYERRNKPEDALGYYIQAAAIDPFSILARKNAGRIFYQQKKFSRSVEILKEIIHINPQDAGAHSNLAMILILQLRRPEEARFHLFEALRLEPDSPNAKELERLRDYYYPSAP